MSLSPSDCSGTSKPAGLQPFKTHEEIRKALAEAVPEKCWDWPYAFNGVGYGKLGWHGAVVDAHRLVCLLAHGDPAQPKMDAAHSCGNRACINPHHLRWATRKQNHADMLGHGTLEWGENRYNSKLTASDVIEIRTLCASGLSHSTIAQRYGVVPSLVSRIKTGKAWKNLKA